MRHVWIFNHYAETPHNGSGTRHLNLARHLRRFGWTASVVGSSVRHTSGQQRLSDNETFALEVYDEVTFLFLRSPSYSGNGPSRILNMMVYSVRCMQSKYLNLLVRPEAIVGSSVHPFAALAAWYLSRRYKVPFIFEVRDLWPQTLIDLGRIKEDSVISKVLRKLELFLFKKADRVITLMPFASNYIEQQGVSKSKVVWLSNGVDLSSFPPSAIVEHPLNGSFVLMYFGAHGIANDLATLLNSIAYLDSNFPDEMRMANFKLRLIGDGPLKSSLKDMVQKFDLKHSSVVFEAAVPRLEIPELAQQADAFVLTVLDRPKLYRYGISMNKLFDYMAASRPVIISSNAANNPVADALCGVSVPAENPVALGNGILEILRMSQRQRRLMGRRGREHVKEYYDYKVLAKRFSFVLDDVVGGEAPG